MFQVVFNNNIKLVMTSFVTERVCASGGWRCRGSTITRCGPSPRRWALIGGEEVTWPQCSPLIGGQVQEQPEHSSERDKRVEFSVPTWLVLNGLEAMGYKVELQTNFRKDFKITDKVANLHKQISHPLGGPMAMYCHPNFISIYRGLMPVYCSV